MKRRNFLSILGGLCLVPTKLLKSAPPVKYVPQKSWIISEYKYIGSFDYFPVASSDKNLVGSIMEEDISYVVPMHKIENNPMDTIDMQEHMEKEYPQCDSFELIKVQNDTMRGIISIRGDTNETINLPYMSKHELTEIIVSA